MAKQVTPRELAMFFLSFLSRYAYREEIEILGLENAAKEAKDSFQKYFSSLLVLLWTKALRSSFPRHHKEIYATFLENYSTILAKEAGQRNLGFDYHYLAEFLELSKKKDGLVFIATFFASMVKRNKQEQLAVTKRILKRMLQHLKFFVDSMHGAKLEIPGAAPDSMDILASPLTTTVENLVNKIFFAGPPMSEEVDVTALLDDDSQVPNSAEDTQLDVQIPEYTAPPSVPPASFSLQEELAKLPPIEQTTPPEVQEIIEVADGENADRRAHVRLPSVSARIVLENSVRELSVVDFSLGGVAIQHEGWRFKEKDVIVFDLIHSYKVIMTEIPVRVLWYGPETMGCSFGDMTPEQNKTLQSYLAALEKKAATRANG